MKKFVVTGTPRSGTTFFCRTLEKESNILLPRFHNYEPFIPQNRIVSSNRIGISAFDEAESIKRIVKFGIDNNFDAVGFKTFFSFHYNFEKMLEQNELDHFLILRRNVWKIFASYWMAFSKSEFGKSSLIHEAIQIDTESVMSKIIKQTIDAVLKTYMYRSQIEQHPNHIVTLYFEDFTAKSGHIGDSELTEYFGKRIIFQSGYDDPQHKPSDYIKNIQEIKEKFVDPLLNSKAVAGLPQDVLESLHNDCI